MIDIDRMALDDRTDKYKKGILTYDKLMYTNYLHSVPQPDIDTLSYLELMDSYEKEGGHPKLFISYSNEENDNESNIDWIVSLVYRLVAADMIVIFDQFCNLIGESIDAFVKTSIDDSDVVLSILSPSYKKKAMGRKRYGVKKEYSIISEKITKETGIPKFKPVLKSGEIKDSVPKAFKGLRYTDLRDMNKYEDELRKLIDNIIYKYRHG